MVLAVRDDYQPPSCPPSILLTTTSFTTDSTNPHHRAAHSAHNPPVSCRDPLLQREDCIQKRAIRIRRIKHPAVPIRWQTLRARDWGEWPGFALMT
jgi:hypothetical protein